MGTNSDLSFLPNTSPRPKTLPTDKHKLHLPGPLLIVGAGGIGSEVVASFTRVLEGEIVLVDMDTIDVSNLNRQAFFTEKHVGEPKAKVLAEQALQRARHPLRMSFYTEDIHSARFSVGFFQQFFCVLCCVDNVPARERINTMCFLAGTPWIESGSAGYLGQVYTVLPQQTECFACTGPDASQVFPVCTLRGTPTEWAHCVHWALKELIPQLEKRVGTGEETLSVFAERYADKLSSTDLGRVLSETLGSSTDTDTGPSTDARRVPCMTPPLSPESVSFVHAVSSLRAKHHAIEIPSEKHTQNIADSTVPSLITTNTILGSLMVLELRLLAEGKNGHVFYLAHAPPVKKMAVRPPAPCCSVCSCTPHVRVVGSSTTLRCILEPLGLLAEPDLSVVKHKGTLLYDSELAHNLDVPAHALHLVPGTLLKAHAPDCTHLIYLAQ
ncbi:ubiquitin-like 1-activating enzyme E1 B [Nematocida sp. AWRm77]|nr:ubiquitin-like 1-activating enzyme E1 B [Nematocida sp. AWRm77]